MVRPQHNNGMHPNPQKPASHVRRMWARMMPALDACIMTKKYEVENLQFITPPDWTFQPL
jgi:hypothetical protein